MIATAILLEACPGPSSFDVAAFLRMPRPAFFTSGVALLYIATVLTVISGFHYLQAAWPVLIGNSDPAQEVPKEDSPEEDSSPKNVRVPFIG
jgi:phosphatidylglycerophosphate synthase